MSSFFKENSRLNCLVVGIGDFFDVDMKVVGNNADAVELRLDMGEPGVDETGVKNAVEHAKSSGLMTIATCRRPEDGGRFEGNEDYRISLLNSALEAGSDFADVEFNSRAESLIDEYSNGGRFILSYHDFEGVPTGIKSIAKEMMQRPAALYKIAARVERYGDNLRILRLHDYFKANNKLSTCFGMGEKAIYSRVFMFAYGGVLSYVAMPDKTTAKGQLSINDVKRYRLKDVTSGTKLFGVIGNPIAHSLSPEFHNYVFEIYGDDAVFLPFFVDELDDFLSFARMVNLHGMAVTFPWKKMENFADFAKIEDTVRRYGSGNTVYRDDLGYRFTDTDREGFAAFFESTVQKPPKSVVILGAGNTAAKIADYLQVRGYNLSIASRTPSKKRAQGFEKANYIEYFEINRVNKEMIINCTPFGVSDGVDESFFEGIDFSDVTVIDLNYSLHGDTKFLKLAARTANRIFNGLDMFKEQAALQHKLWMKRKTSDDVLKSVFSDQEKSDLI